MSTRNLNFLMNPSSIVLISTTRNRSLVADHAARNILDAGFRGKLFAIGSFDEEIKTVAQVVRDIEDLPVAPDLAVAIADPHSVRGLTSKLGKRGTKAAIVMTGGAEERMSSDNVLRNAILEEAKNYGLRILGLSSPAVIAPGANLNVSCAHKQALKGNIAFVSQSSALLGSVLDWATARGIGFSHLVSLGSIINVDICDMLDYLTNDLKAQAILLYIESISNARKFMSAARLASRIKPVIVLKGDRYANEACPSLLFAEETAGSDAVYDAAFRRAGMLRVYGLQELFDSAETLSKARSIVGDRLAILSNGRGIGIIAKDALMDEGGRLAEPSPESLIRLDALLPSFWSRGNPVDILEDADASRYADALGILLEDKGIDAVLALHSPNALSSGEEISKAAVEAIKKSAPRPGNNRLFTNWLGDETSSASRKLFQENNIPSFRTPRQAVRGFMQVVHFRRNQDMLTQTPICIPDLFSPDSMKAKQAVRRSLEVGRSWLAEDAVRDVLTAYGIPQHTLVDLENSHELMAGIFEDGLFGPIVFFGHGGKAAEAIQDVAMALPPLNLHLAKELISRTRISRMLEGHCGSLAANVDSIALALVKISQLICDIPEINVLEINPLFADDRDIAAGKIRIRVEKRDVQADRRLAIRPYPQELEEIINLPDGQKILLRPIRAEDEPAYHRLFARLPAEDIYMRFMGPLKVLPRYLAARLTQIDYDREMALVLFGENEAGESDLYGGVRISADSDNERAEFAILLSREMTGMGLGPMMMRRIIRYARSRGIKEIYGEVLSGNTPMLKLCKALGFSTKRMLDDPGIVIATLTL